MGSFLLSTVPTGSGEMGQEYALRELTERPECCALPPFEHDAAFGRKGSNLPFAARSTNDRIWHKVRAHPGAYEGTKTAAMPTLGVEGQFSAALQTGC